MTEEAAPPPNIIRDFVNQLGVQVTPLQNQGAWTVMEQTDAEGRKHAYGALIISDPNGVRAYFFHPDLLKAFLENTANFYHQQLLPADRSVNPLSVASLEDLKKIAGQNGHGPGHPIEWPPNPN